MKPYIAMQWEIEALLTGRKTRITVPMDPQPIMSDRYAGGGYVDIFPPSESVHHRVALSQMSARAPLGVPGDRIWVQEEFAISKSADEHELAESTSSAPVGYVWYSSSPEQGSINSSCRGRWRPADTMPRWASRITLDVTSVRVERVKDTDEGMAKDEGHRGGSPFGGDTSLSCFAQHWQSRYGDWDGNPHGFVAEVRRVEG